MNDLPIVNNGSVFDKYYWNNVCAELQNSIIGTGMILDESNSYQLSEIISSFVAAADFFTDTGSANNYVLNLPLGDFPKKYVNGMRVRFVAANSNTENSYVNINNIGSKQIKKNGGSSILTNNDILANDLVELVYNSVNDYFEMIFTKNVNDSNSIISQISMWRSDTFKFSFSNTTFDFLMTFGTGIYVSALDRTFTPNLTNSIIEYELNTALALPDDAIYQTIVDNCTAQAQIGVYLDPVSASQPYGASAFTQFEATNTDGFPRDTFQFTLRTIFHNSSTTPITFKIAVGCGGFLSGNTYYLGNANTMNKFNPTVVNIPTSTEIKITEYII